MQHYQFKSIQEHVHMGPGGTLKRVTEGVALQNGQGVKAVEIQQNKDIQRAVRPLSATEITNIQGKQFMPKLFADCHGDCQAKAEQGEQGKKGKQVKKTKAKPRKTGKKGKTKKQQKR